MPPKRLRSTSARWNEKRLLSCFHDQDDGVGPNVLRPYAKLTNRKMCGTILSTKGWRGANLSELEASYRTQCMTLRPSGHRRGESRMPTYEYVCRSCEHRFEQWQKMADDPLEICPECGGHIRRVLYPAGVVFKGSGFYTTDHSASGSNGHNHKQEEPAASTEAKPAGDSPSSTSSSSSGETKAAASTTT